MRIRIYLSPKKVEFGIIALLAIVCGTFTYHAHNYRDQIPGLERQVHVLEKANAHQSFKDHHPKIRKTVPSAYKKMMIDGKIVCKAENQLIQYASTHHTTKLDMNNQHVHYESNTLKQYISGNKLTDGDAYNNPWTNDTRGHVSLAPGASDEDGMYECSFIVENPQTHTIDNILNGIYDSQTRRFEDITEHNTDSVTDKEQREKPKARKKRGNRKVNMRKGKNKKRMFKQKNHKPQRKNQHNR